MKTTWFKAHLIKFLYIQLFITLVSLPILISWGLPISGLTILGNFVFTPLLMAFLFISSLIFFLELLNLPNQFLIYILTYITKIWNTILSLGSNKFLIGFPLVNVFLLALIPIFTLLIIHNKYINNHKKGIFAFLCLFFIIFISFKVLYSKKDFTDTINCSRNQLIVSLENKKIILNDNGAFNRKFSYQSWIDYNLTTYLYKSFGHTNIDILVLSKPGKQPIKILEYLASRLKIKKIDITSWNNYSFKKNYINNLQKLALSKNIEILN